MAAYSGEFAVMQGGQGGISARTLGCDKQNLCTGIDFIKDMAIPILIALAPEVSVVAICRWFRRTVPILLSLKNLLSPLPPTPVLASPPRLAVLHPSA